MDITPITSGKRSKTLGYVLIGLILIVIIGAGIWLLRGPLMFSGMRYLAGPFESRQLYEVGLTGTHTVTLPVSGRVTDYARASNHEAVITASDAKNQDVYVLTGNTSKALTRDGGTKSSLDISADGAFVAYAVNVATTSTTSPAAFYAPSSWEIMLASTASGTPRAIGKGYGPHFFAKDGSMYLAYTSTIGLHIVNLQKNSHQDIPVNVGVVNGFFSTTVSPDGTSVIIPTLSKYSLFKLSESNGLFSISEPQALPSGTSAIAFKGSTIVSAARGYTQTFLRSSPLGNPDIISRGKQLSQGIIYKLIP